MFEDETPEAAPAAPPANPAGLRHSLYYSNVAIVRGRRSFRMTAEDIDRVRGASAQQQPADGLDDRPAQGVQ